VGTGFAGEDAPMFVMSLRFADHVREYSVSARQGAGWEVKLEEDRTLKRHARYRDWHRVERTLVRFRREVADLMAQGWQIQAR
jgi:hypothetical protein